MEITKKQAEVLTHSDHRTSRLEILICLNNTIDEAREKICESIDAFINAKLTSDKVMQGVLKDIRASIDDVGDKNP